MKKIQEIEVSGKRVLVRVDFNVSLDKEGKVIDDFRIRATWPTINYLKEKGAKIILLAHLGRPEGKKDLTFSLKPLLEKVNALNNESVILLEDYLGEGALKEIEKMKPGGIIMLENLRWHPGEEKNDLEFAKLLARLADVYINDAFAVSHRAHASVEAITKFLPSGAGLLLQKEVFELSRVRDNPEHPLVAIIGGSKISTKIKLIQSFFNKAESIILGGALANTVLRAKGIAIGKSFFEEKALSAVKSIPITDPKIHLPVDAIVCQNKEATGLCSIRAVGKVNDEEMLLDIGPDSEKLFSQIIARAKMVVWNGPMGLFENETFSHGTRAIAQAIANSSAYSLVGGGETVAFLEKESLIDDFSFVSTGGGAMLEFLAGEPMPGILALEKK